ncbi:Photosystem I reaction center subunit III [Spirulina major CS-329]|uniref:Photosystem I reaction center subunit III n=1 Tax=Spirulina TaxID=1154 RepID=UPI00232BE555|nr:MULTISPECIES: Photosystem I reaction center subunit III [Spirulina]MDB9495592.1 Photosystem I reaction center subunit III [Spirulina subsalsa CS-330]MDB9501853.1 Photosystem I reaction center subunit III [Spirulina major CS-329]
MRKLLALILVATLWLNFAPAASADDYGLVPCSESAAYLQKSKSFLNTTADPQSGQKRAERYSEALCGPEGYPHLIVDGRWDHVGDFTIPGLMFLYAAGWIGWVGRAYLIAIRDDKDAEMKEIIIDVPLAFKLMLGGFAWPLAAFGEFTSGKMTVADSDVPISPR